MNIDTSGVEAQVISAGDSYFAVPWESGGGGPVYVGLLDQKGKMDIPADAPVLAGHREAVACTEFSPFDGRVLATAGDDARIRVWRLPDPSTGGLKETWNAEPGMERDSIEELVVIRVCLRICNIQCTGRLW